MDIVVKGRHTAVSERFRKHVQTKLAKLERLDSKVMRVDAELSEERNPRLSGIRERIELTVYSRGPVIRAEAAAADPYAALDLAASKLAERLRRAASRRNDHHPSNHHSHSSNHHRGHQPAAPAPGTPDAPSVRIPGTADASPAAGEPVGEVRNGSHRAGDADGYDVPDHSPMVVREKTHVARPMTLDDALSNMELVGHDFYLFQDAVTGMPSVVYRRCGYDYGVIRLGQPDGDGEPGIPAGDDARTLEPAGMAAGRGEHLATPVGAAPDGRR